MLTHIRSDIGITFGDFVHHFDNRLRLDLTAVTVIRHAFFSTPAVDQRPPGINCSFIRLGDIFRGRIIDVTSATYTIEMTGAGSKLDSFIEALSEHKILETVRSGVSGIARGDRSLHI